MTPGLPPVAPSVTAELVEALSPRLRKRLDAGIAKLSGYPLTVDGDTVRLAVDADTDLELHAPSGVVTTPDAIRCGCLLAPACLHRAAAASAAPVGELGEVPDVGPGGEPVEGLPGEGAGGQPGTKQVAGPGGESADGQDGEAADASDTASAPAAETNPVDARAADDRPGPTEAAPAKAATPDPAPAEALAPDSAPAKAPTPIDSPAKAPTPNGEPAKAPTSIAAPADPLTSNTPPKPHPDPEPEPPTPAQHTAAHALRTAAAAVLDAGTDGAGAVLQAELLRAAHTARLAGLPRAAASAVSVVTGLRAARGADPSYRLAELVAALRDVLGSAHRIPHARGAELAALRGSVRQPYTPDGSLRVYGIFSEPVLTATGYAGAVTWTADAEGRLYTVSDVAPGGPGRAVGAADRAVRIGDTALSHRELSRAGLAVSGATVSPTGRLGAGAKVRAVRASGAAWHADPLDRLWAVPAADQAARALAEDGQHDLLFLDVTLVGTVREAAGDCLLADCGGLPVRLAAAHDHPALPHRDNLRLLAAARGSRLRVVARLAPAAHARALLLAVSHPTDPETRLDLGLDRLQHADLPTEAPAAPAAVPPATDEAPLHLLRRRVHQAASGGRRVLAFPGDGTADSRRLRGVGLGTAADLLAELHAAAADRTRDVFGRLVPADLDRFARAWLAAALYTAEVDRALCAAAWGAAPERP
ncbi:hypothetical protein AB0I00_12950 [Streptomyces sp. NPDC050803]|uniref:hypothetical protein n=1 Tax=unclassified Streptomyces TaxID=2593676 RepID=UPI003440C43C